MGFLDKLQDDLKKNLQEGMEIFKEGSSVITEKIEQLTEGSKSKYKIFNINMKIQEEYAKLGEEIYSLIEKKAKNPLGGRSVKSVIARIKKLEVEIGKLEPGDDGAPKKSPPRKSAGKPASKTAKKAAKKPVRKKTARPATKRRAKTGTSASPSGKSGPEEQ